MPATVTTADSPGTRYLVERRRAYAQSEQELKRARELRDLVDSLSAQHGGQAEHRLCPGAGVALSSAVLIPRRDSVEVRTRLTEVLGRQHGVRILVHGPWPPYTFVGQKGWAGALKRGGVEA